MTALLALVLAGAQADPLLSVDLAAGPVASGLDRLARQAGQAVVARPGDLAGRDAAALRGQMRLSQALARWCRPAGLSCRQIAGGIVVRAETPQHRPIPAVRARPAAPPPPAPVIGPDVIVTGRRGTTIQGELERSYSASHLDAITLARRPPQSLAELLSGLPGLWVDTSAGAAANTIRVRGIPLDGYQGIAVQVDGLPVQHDTLPWTDIDQFVRPDLMIESADYVRGGPSAIFASNAPGGVLNLRTRAPVDRPGGAVRVTASDYGLARWEGYATAPIAPGWRMIAGGMIASDPTVRRIAATLGGGQMRARLDHDLGGGGTLSLAIHTLADDTLNISSFPMRIVQGQIRPLPGFDPRRGSFFGPELSDLRFATLGDRPFGRNNRNRMVVPSLSLTQPVADGILSVRAHIRASRTERYALSSSGNAIPAAQALAEAAPRLAAAFPGTASVTLTHASDGTAFTPLPDNDLVVALNPVAADTRLAEGLADISYARRLEAAGRHDLTLGLYAVGYRWDFRRAVARALLEAREQGRRLDLTALDGDGRALGRLTDDGLLNTGSTYEAMTGRQHMIALYAADEWQIAERWRIDWGLRHERARLSAVVERATTRDGGDPATLADDRIAIGSGQWDDRRERIARTAATVALHWRANSATGVFARMTRAMRLPDPGVFRVGGGDPARAMTIEQGELGLIWRQDRLGFDATLFASRFPNIALPDLSLDPVTGAVRVGTNAAAARTIGLELGTRAAPVQGVTLRGTVTIQDPRLQSYRLTSLADGIPVVTDLSGRIPRRVPRMMASLSASAALPGTGITLDGDVSAMGRRFADDANSLALPGFAILGLGARWTASPALTVQLRATNLLDRIAVMQGDALGGEIRAGGTDGIVTVRAQQGRVVSLSAEWRR
ncbi:TonB-dependent receptor [Sphingomonas sp. CFBP8993]|uniref:TonB-dependent receptor n=1 Tax=Sphingomonas sp. CFBP8993 TaxID=3096526 RepID=UPI002A6AEA57|nr:TonB-dependent receptor [Sphingomonas sp. CFBP8993]MDY0957067.1 TonB-dependent receptor [Sphingomonas sp. CFBP8993]